VIETLGLIPGVEYAGLIDSPALGSPCASRPADGASVLNDVTPQEYREVQADLRAQLRAADADAILTHHHKCHREWSKFAGDDLPIVHYEALVAEALGLDLPDRFQTLWRLGDPEQVLAKTRPHWESWGITEAAAREMVKKFFVPEYAAAVQRCPCEGTCFAVAAGFRDADASCLTTTNRNSAS
jgi:hypothetical protein